MAELTRSLEFRPDDEHSRVIRLTYEVGQEFSGYDLDVEIEGLRRRHGALTRGGEASTDSSRSWPKGGEVGRAFASGTRW